MNGWKNTMNELSLELLHAGFTVNPEHVVLQTRRLSHRRFPSMFGVIQHPKEGVILYDTGYSNRFYEQTKRFPGRAYSLITPVTLHDADLATSQLAQRGIHPSDVRTVVISHFHADHVCALADFPNATYVYLGTAYEAVRGLTGFQALMHAVLPGLLPTDFEARSRPIDSRQLVRLPPEMMPFDVGYDLFGDGSILGVELPGHVAGQLGLFLQTDEGPWFLVADSCWTAQSYQEQRLPHPVTRLLFDDYKVYGETLSKLGSLWRSSDIRLVPSHCEETLARYAG